MKYSDPTVPEDGVSQPASRPNNFGRAPPTNIKIKKLKSVSPKVNSRGNTMATQQLQAILDNGNN